MISLSSIEMYNLLRAKIGEKGVEAIKKYITVQVKETFQSEKEHLPTKEDLVREIGLVRKEIAEAKTDIIKWVFAFFIAVPLMIIGLYFKK